MGILSLPQDFKVTAHIGMEETTHEYRLNKDKNRIKTLGTLPFYEREGRRTNRDS